MRDRNAFVTRDTTRESQYPVPTRPYPTRPALYMGSVETGHHLVTYVTPESSDAMMTLTGVDVDAETIEHLDFTPAIPCEHSDHLKGRHGTAPAAYLVEFGCQCGRRVRYAICETGMAVFVTHGVFCRGCGRGTDDYTDSIVIVEVLPR